MTPGQNRQQRSTLSMQRGPGGQWFRELANHVSESVSTSCHGQVALYYAPPEHREYPVSPNSYRSRIVGSHILSEDWLHRSKWWQRFWQNAKSAEAMRTVRTAKASHTSFQGQQVAGGHAAPCESHGSSQEPRALWWLMPKASPPGPTGNDPKLLLCKVIPMAAKAPGTELCGHGHRRARQP